MNKFVLSSLFLMVGLIGGYLANNLMQHPSGSDAQSTHRNLADAEALYWVAPMDPNYRRDKPGKSPMGMDLVPVYEESQSATQPGLVTIDPSVENNLGVRTAKVELGEFAVAIETVGMLTLNENSRWQLNSRVSGWLEKLAIKAEGERVNAGQYLMSIYSPELVKAQDDLLNALNMGNKRLIASAKTRLQVLGMSEQQVARVLKQRRSEQLVELYAPSSAYISTLGVREGAYITPATTLIDAGALDKIWLIGELFESQAGLVAEGDHVEMRVDSYPGHTWQGKINYIYPNLDPQTRTLRARMVFDNQDERLKPNMYARVTISSMPEQQTLTIPSEAVIRGGRFDRVVMKRGTGKYQSVRVEIGRESQGVVEVLDGLVNGDVIVTSAQFMLDSESSLSADFSRIGPPDRQIESVQATGIVVAVKPGVLTIAHEPVLEWEWPDMVMDFPLAAEQIDEQIVPGRELQFTITKQDQQFPISNLKLGALKLKKLEPLDTAVDHSTMDHSQMNHGSIDHSAMDHSTMDHSTMDHSQMGDDNIDHSTMDHSEMDHSNMEHSQHSASDIDPDSLSDDDLDWLDLDNDEGER
ncbi:MULTISPECIES: efflux RND transporter periplasmic adaptor subunit [unclassified Agarivorans]|uniref:efflux RND transporter periplasmic adaptor subunit n=1 Tax=unclassified Agarivorans TaxID=2636026 RepID=UPI0026E186AF|nr:MULTISPECIES: efflux RND transporter periplasmic adaptor subunit [unclassified Agarivorans]MDO6684076.1 efflux RND transporter periplasmic adaptor subunit [Agarivorans sp. 3_MG-2023]MDO6714190.1 efflux RND transporter periplasmic adaptor subunit [Agarivorans sp. 2_MG-2023]